MIKIDSVTVTIRSVVSSATVSIDRITINRSRPSSLLWIRQSDLIKHPDCESYLWFCMLSPGERARRRPVIVLVFVISRLFAARSWKKRKLIQLLSSWELVYRNNCEKLSANFQTKPFCHNWNKICYYYDCYRKRPISKWEKW